MYVLCLEKLEELKQKYPGLIFPYYTFEEAKSTYLHEIGIYKLSCDKSIKELISLMDFVYVGRNILEIV